MALGSIKMCASDRFLEGEQMKLGNLEKNKSEEGLETRQELKRSIIISFVLRSLHRKQGTMSYLIQTIEPYLKKADRQLFGLPF